MVSNARLISIFLGLALTLLFGAALLGPYIGWPGRGIESRALRMELGSFATLEGWQDDNLLPAFAAFLRSCDRMNEMPPERLMGRSIKSGVLTELYGHVSDWQEVCAVASVVDGAHAAEIRTYFESLFIPVRIYDDKEDEGLFTGYYEPQLRGSRIPTKTYSVPLLTRPDDLISVDLSQFRSDLKGERLAGKIIKKSLVPYGSRAAIESTLQKDQALVWVDNAVDAFFLHIQGSGRVVLDTGEIMRVGYSASNGHPYTAIGRVLIERGALNQEEVSMQTIRTWLEAHPGDAREIMNSNASYVFFQALDSSDPALGPVGAQNVSLTSGRSLAVDLRFHALGAPVWVAGLKPVPLAGAGISGEVPFRQLMVMQDTGGAIRGVGRADIFWGFGPEAGALAGRMKHRGSLTILIPKRLAATVNQPRTAQ